MKQLLSIEYAKVRNYKTFWIILLIYAAMVPLSFWGLSSIDFPFLPGDAELYGFPTVWNYITYAASWWNLLLGVLVVILICNDIRFKTQRQHIIDGLSKQQVIISKFLILVALAAAVTLYTFLIGFIFGAINSPISEVFSGLKYVGIYFIQTIGYFSFAFLFANLVRQPALSIILYVVIFVLKFIFPLILGDTVAQFMPINVISDLTPFPFFQEMLNMIEKNSSDIEVPLIISQGVRSLVASGWILLFVLISYIVLKRRDV